MTNNINTNNPTLTTDIIHTELSPQRSLISEVSNAIFSDITNAKTQEVSPLNNVVIPNQPASAIKPTLVVNNNMAYTVSVFLDSLSQSTFFDAKVGGWRLAAHP